MLDSGEITVSELVREVKKTIEEKNSINAFIEVYDVDEEVKKAEEMINSGKQKPLTGIPIGIKDVLCMDGKEITSGSKILKGYVAPYDATVIEKLKDQGAILIGRTNMDEFAMGSSTEYSSYGPTKNPVDEERSPGGSSGGSAAAVASGMVPLAIGTDTGGSIRQPASFCGIVGLKPTYGSVSRYGLISLGSSLDVIGCFARNVEDTKMFFEAIKDDGDNYDSTIGIHPFSNSSNKKIIGVVEGFDNVNSKDFDNTIEKLKESGYEIKTLKIELINKASSIYYIIQPAEASSNLARFDGIRYGDFVEGDDLWGGYINTRTQGFGDEVKRRIILGTYVLSSGYYDAYYRKAVKAREKLKEEFSKALSEVDVIMMPTTLDVAFKRGEKVDAVSMYEEDKLTYQANLTGLPAISVPVNKEGLPLGMQIIGNYNNEDLILEYAGVIEEIV